LGEFGGLFGRLNDGDDANEAVMYFLIFQCVLGFFLVFGFYFVERGAFVRLIDCVVFGVPVRPAKLMNGTILPFFLRANPVFSGIFASPAIF